MLWRERRFLNFAQGFCIAFINFFGLLPHHFVVRFFIFFFFVFFIFFLIFFHQFFAFFEAFFILPAIAFVLIYILGGRIADSCEINGRHIVRSRVFALGIRLVANSEHQSRSGCQSYSQSIKFFHNQILSLIELKQIINNLD